MDSSLTGRKYMPNIHTITTAEELKTRIKADVSVTVPLEGIAIEASSSYLRSVETSKTSKLRSYRSLKRSFKMIPSELMLST